MSPPRDDAGLSGGASGAPAAARTILHVDMDAFFVSVELLRRPELRGRPVVVGGAGPRGVVAAASYEARAHGVHSAMPSVRARRLCPHAVFLPGDHPHYAEASARLMDCFGQFTPLVEPLSLDEAFLDISGTRRRLGAPAQVGRMLRELVRERESLVCSIGIAPNKFLAKLATGAAKPRASSAGPVEGGGVHVIEPGGELRFLHPLDVGELWGVGPATLGKLRRLGVGTVGDLAALPLPAVTAALGEAVGRHLHALAHGLDDRPVVAHQRARSVSHEQTFAVDRHSLDELRPELVRLADGVASRLRAQSLRARTVQVKVRFADFSTVTRSITLSEATDRGTEMCEQAGRLLERLPVARGVRLLGVAASGLDDRPEQLQFGLEGDADDGWGAANEAVDAIRGRFGDRLIGPARLAGRPGRSPAAPWGPDPVVRDSAPDPVPDRTSGPSGAGPAKS